MQPSQSALLHTCLLLLLSCFTLATEIGVIAIKEQSVSVPCRAFISARRVPGRVTLVRWLHSSFHKPLYTLDLRSLNISLLIDSSLIHMGRHFPSPETDGRFYLDLSLNPIALRIDPVLPEDAGIYTCKIDYRNRRSVHSSVKLDVYIPPKEAVIFNADGNKVEGVIGPFKIGDTVKLICRSEGGFPTPAASWRSNIVDYRRISINGSILTIYSLERHDQWSHHTCTVQNTNMTSPKSVTAIIEMVLPPLELQLHSNILRPFISGQSVQISCQSFGSYPKAHVIWTKDRQSLKAEERVTDNGNVTTSFIEFTARASDDGAEVECMAFNPDLQSHILRRTFIIKVHYKPEVQIVILSNQSQLSEGNNLILLCNVKANPSTYNIIWIFNDKEIYNESSIIIKNNTLYIKYLRKKYSGKFICVARNDKGEGVDTVNITVKHRPICQEMEVSENDEQEKNVTCKLESYSTDVTFYWTLSNSTSNVTWSTGHESHTLIKLQKAVSELQCWGINEIGVQIIPCKITLADVTKSNGLYLQAVLVTICLLVVCLCIVYIITKRYKHKYKLKSVSVQTELAHVKDTSCGRLITKCVEPSITSTESDCSANLLGSNKTNFSHSEKFS